MLSLETPFREKLFDLYRTAPLDIASFHRFYKACALEDCLGLCCNGGSGFYMKEESETIQKLVNENRAFFDEQKLGLTDKIFDEELDEETGEIELSTNTREINYPSGLLCRFHQMRFRMQKHR